MRVASLNAVNQPRFIDKSERVRSVTPKAGSRYNLSLIERKWARHEHGTEPGFAENMPFHLFNPHSPLCPHV